MSIILNEKQQEGLEIAVQRYKDHKRYTCIGGVAGSGKTELAKQIIERLGVPPSKVVYTSYTGKACEVLRQRGNQNVSTIHKLIYDSVLQRDGHYQRTKKKEISYSVVVIDEISMVSRELMRDLFSYDAYFICLGDPFQLPPVQESDEVDSNNHLLDDSHIFLDEIHRQAEGSEIIQVATAIRKNIPLKTMDGKDVKIFERNQLSSGMLLWADQIICATNKTRREINEKVRELKGLRGAPKSGDKVICLKNYWSTISLTGAPLINGMIGTIADPYSSQIHVDPWLARDVNLAITNAIFMSEDNEDFGCLPMNKDILVRGEKTIPWQKEYRILKKKPYLLPYEFDYGYCISGHKSQGSQWRNVLVVEENFPCDFREHQRWLYTCATRTSSKLIIIKR